MKISILLEELEDTYKIQTESSTYTCDDSFESIRFFSHDASAKKSNILYLTEYAPSTNDLYYYCLTTTTAEINIESSNCPFKIVEILQEILEKYNLWYRTCLDTIISGATPNELLDYASSVLNNPIALFDPDSVIVAQSGAFLNDITGTIWEEINKLGYSPVDFFNLEDQRKIRKELAENINGIVSITLPNPKHQYLILQLYHNNHYYGSLGQVDINVPFSDGQKAYVLEVRDIMLTYMKHNQNYLKVNNSVHYYLNQLLQGLPMEKHILKHYLNAKGWNINDSYSLMLFSSPVPVTDSQSEYSHIKRISSMIPSALLFAYEGFIIGIVRNTDFSPKACAHKQLMINMLNKIKLRCFVSSPFENFADLKYSYIQCKSIYAYAASLSDTLLFFDEHYEKVFFNTINQITSPKSLCHPKLLSLYQSSDTQSSTLINNLKCYLLNGRCLAITSRALKLHRNTLIYRIQKIESILECELKDITPEQAFYLLMSCYIIENFYKETS